VQPVDRERLELALRAQARGAAASDP